MTDLQTQIRGYATQLDESQSPIDTAEVMARREAVKEVPRVRQRIDRADGPGLPGWGYAMAAAFIAVALGGIIWLAGSGGDTGPADAPTTLPSATTLPPATTVVTPTTAPPTTVAAVPSGLVPTVSSVGYYGGDGFDYATGVAALPDGGFVTAIDYRSSDSVDGDLILARYSAADELEWARSWSTGSGDNPMRRAISVDATGAIYVGMATIGVEQDVTLLQDLTLIKFGSDGELIWQRWAPDVFGGQRPHVVVAADDGSVFVAGHHEVEVDGARENRLLVMRVGSDGEVLWQRGFAGDGLVQETAYGGTLHPSGDLIISGTVGEGGEVDALVARVDAEGNIVWQRSWGVPGAPDRAWSVVTDPQGSIYVSGPVFGVGDGGDQVFVFKVDADGALQWSRIWTIPDNELWATTSAFGDVSLVLSGYIGRVDAGGVRMDQSSYLLGVSPEGELLWQAAVGARPLESMEGIAFTADGSLIGVGQGERAEPNVVALGGEWLSVPHALVTTELVPMGDADLPWVEAGGVVGDAGGAVGGGSDADALLIRFELP